MHNAFCVDRFSLDVYSKLDVLSIGPRHIVLFRNAFTDPFRYSWSNAFDAFTRSFIKDEIDLTMVLILTECQFEAATLPIQRHT